MSFSLEASQVFSVFLVLSSFPLMCLGMVFFALIFFGICSVS